MFRSGSRSTAPTLLFCRCESDERYCAEHGGDRGDRSSGGARGDQVGAVDVAMPLAAASNPGGGAPQRHIDASGLLAPLSDNNSISQVMSELQADYGRREHAAQRLLQVAAAASAELRLDVNTFNVATTALQAVLLHNSAVRSALVHTAAVAASPPATVQQLPPILSQEECDEQVMTMMRRMGLR